MKKTSVFAVFCLAMLVLSWEGTPVFAQKALRVHHIKQPLTDDPSAKIWETVPQFTVNLMAQSILMPTGGGSVAQVQVRALHNGKKVAFQLVWNDETEDIENAVDTFRDSVALMFPVHHSKKDSTSPLMGFKGLPVNIWQWRADWQAEAEGRRNLEARQPLSQGVWISPLDQQILKTRYPGKPSPKATTIEYVSEGFGTLTRQEQQDVMAQGVHQDGQWTIVFLRDLERQDLSDTEFAPKIETVINFAVWNGSEKDVNGRKSVSLVWTPLVFD